VHRHTKIGKTAAEISHVTFFITMVAVSHLGLLNVWTAGTIWQTSMCHP